MKKSYWGALLALLLVGTMLFGCVAATAAPAGSGSRVGRRAPDTTFLLLKSRARRAILRRLVIAYLSNCTADV